MEDKWAKQENDNFERRKDNLVNRMQTLESKLLLITVSEILQ